MDRINSNGNGPNGNPPSNNAGSGWSQSNGHNKFELMPPSGKVTARQGSLSEQQGQQGRQQASANKDSNSNPAGTMRMASVPSVAQSRGTKGVLVASAGISHTARDLAIVLNRLDNKTFPVFTTTDQLGAKQDWIRLGDLVDSLSRLQEFNGRDTGKLAEAIRASNPHAGWSVLNGVVVLPKNAYIKLPGVESLAMLESRNPSPWALLNAADSLFSTITQNPAFRYVDPQRQFDESSAQAVNRFVSQAEENANKNFSTLGGGAFGRAAPTSLPSTQPPTASEQAQALTARMTDLKRVSSHEEANYLIEEASSMLASRTLTESNKKALGEARDRLLYAVGQGYRLSKEIDAMDQEIVAGRGSHTEAVALVVKVNESMNQSGHLWPAADKKVADTVMSLARGNDTLFALPKWTQLLTARDVEHWEEADSALEVFAKDPSSANRGMLESVREKVQQYVDLDQAITTPYAGATITNKARLIGKIEDIDRYINPEMKNMPDPRNGNDKTYFGVPLENGERVETTLKTRDVYGPNGFEREYWLEGVWHKRPGKGDAWVTLGSDPGATVKLEGALNPQDALEKARAAIESRQLAVPGLSMPSVDLSVEAKRKAEAAAGALAAAGQSPNLAPSSGRSTRVEEVLNTSAMVVRGDSNTLNFEKFDPNDQVRTALDKDMVPVLEMRQAVIEARAQKGLPPAITLSGEPLRHDVAMELGLPLLSSLGGVPTIEMLDREEAAKGIVNEVLRGIKKVGGESPTYEAVDAFVLVRGKNEQGQNISSLVRTPLFKVHVAGAEGQTRFVDGKGDRYDNLQQFREKNTLPPTAFFVPQDGTISKDADGRFQLDGFSNIRPGNNKPVMVAKSVVYVGGFAGSVIGTAVTLGKASPVLLPVAGAAGKAALALVLFDSTAELVRLNGVGQSMTGPRALSAGLNLANGLFSVGGAMLPGKLGLALRAGEAGTDLFSLGDSAINLAKNAADMSPLDRMFASAQLAFYLGKMGYDGVTLGKNFLANLNAAAANANAKVATPPQAAPVQASPVKPTPPATPAPATSPPPSGSAKNGNQATTTVPSAVGGGLNRPPSVGVDGSNRKIEDLFTGGVPLITGAGGGRRLNPVQPNQSPPASTTPTPGSISPVGNDQLVRDSIIVGGVKIETSGRDGSNFQGTTESVPMQSTTTQPPVQIDPKGLGLAGDNSSAQLKDSPPWAKEGNRFHPYREALDIAYGAYKWDVDLYNRENPTKQQKLLKPNEWVENFATQYDDFIKQNNATPSDLKFVTALWQHYNLPATDFPASAAQPLSATQGSSVQPQDLSSNAPKQPAQVQDTTSGSENLQQQLRNVANKISQLAISTNVDESDLQRVLDDLKKLSSRLGSRSGRIVDMALGVNSLESDLLKLIGNFRNSSSTASSSNAEVGSSGGPKSSHELEKIAVSLHSLEAFYNLGFDLSPKVKVTPGTPLYQPGVGANSRLPTQVEVGVGQTNEVNDRLISDLNNTVLRDFRVKESDSLPPNLGDSNITARVVKDLTTLETELSKLSNDNPKASNSMAWMIDDVRAIKAAYQKSAENPDRTNKILTLLHGNEASDAVWMDENAALVKKNAELINAVALLRGSAKKDLMMVQGRLKSMVDSDGNLRPLAQFRDTDRELKYMLNKTSDSDERAFYRQMQQNYQLISDVLMTHRLSGKPTKEITKLPSGAVVTRDVITYDRQTHRLVVDADFLMKGSLDDATGVEKLLFEYLTTSGRTSAYSSNITVTFNDQLPSYVDPVTLKGPNPTTKLLEDWTLKDFERKNGGFTSALDPELIKARKYAILVTRMVQKKLTLLEVSNNMGEMGVKTPPELFSGNRKSVLGNFAYSPSVAENKDYRYTATYNISKVDLFSGQYSPELMSFREEALKAKMGQIERLRYVVLGGLGMLGTGALFTLTTGLNQWNVNETRDLTRNLATSDPDQFRASLLNEAEMATLDKSYVEKQTEAAKRRTDLLGMNFTPGMDINSIPQLQNLQTISGEKVEINNSRLEIVESNIQILESVTSEGKLPDNIALKIAKDEFQERLHATDETRIRRLEGGQVRYLMEGVIYESDLSAINKLAGDIQQRVRERSNKVGGELNVYIDRLSRERDRLTALRQEETAITNRMNEDIQHVSEKIDVATTQKLAEQGQSITLKINEYSTQIKQLEQQHRDFDTARENAQKAGRVQSVNVINDGQFFATNEDINNRRLAVSTATQQLSTAINQVRSAEQQIGLAKRQVETAEAARNAPAEALNLAIADYQRFAQLQSQGVISASELGSKKMIVTSAQAALDNAEQAIDIAKAAVVRAEQDLINARDTVQAQEAALANAKAKFGLVFDGQNPRILGQAAITIEQYNDVSRRLAEIQGEYRRLNEQLNDAGLKSGQ